MTNAVANRVSAGALAAAQALKANLGQVAAALPQGGAKGYLKFLQDGTWVFGQDNTELPKGTEVAINPLSIKSGYSCWTDYDKKERKKNELVGEFVVPLGSPIPPKHTMKDTGWDWRDLRIVEMKVLSEGPHKGKELIFSTTSDGGLRAVRAIIEQIMVQIDEDPVNIVPVISLDNDHYMHKQWGKTYTPTMDVVDFISMDGPEMTQQAEEEEAEEQPEEQPKARTRGDSAPAGRGTRQTAPAEEPVEEKAEEPASDGAVRRRRR